MVIEWAEESLAGPSPAPLDPERLPSDRAPIATIDSLANETLAEIMRYMK